MLIAGHRAKQVYPSVKLSRYACYLIVQNADPSKEVVALGQTYFAVQTRLQEIRQMEKYTSPRNTGIYFQRNQKRNECKALTDGFFRLSDPFVVIDSRE